MISAARRYPAWLVVALAFFFSPVVALAQDDHPYALIAGFDASPTVSFQWNFSERFAIRFDGSYNYSRQILDDVVGAGTFTDFTTGTIIRTETTRHSETTNSSTSIAATGIVTIHRAERAHLYLAPRLRMLFTRSRLSQTTTTATPTGDVRFGISATPSNQALDRDDSYVSPGAGLSFGVSTNLHERIALFGELGATYTRSRAPTLPANITGTRSESKTTSVSTRAAAGIMFLF